MFTEERKQEIRDSELEYGSISLERATMRAEEIVLSHVGAYIDWEVGQTTGDETVEIEAPAWDKVDLMMFIEKCSVAELIYLRLDPRLTVCFAACQELKDRYLESEKETIERLADEIRTE